ncbi:MAG: type VI secretion system protein TssA [Pyrinomonadaceae bacterium]
MYSPEEPTTAPVIDLDALLRPVSEEKPAGENLQYSGLYDEIRAARRADLDVAQGQWQHELKTADYRRVIDSAVPALETQTKDLQIAAWLGESLTRIYGFDGLRDSLKLARGLQENFWETCFPEIDEGDQEGRANAIEWMDKECALSIQTVPLTGGERLSYLAWEDSKRFDIPENLDALDSGDQEKFNQLKAQAEQERRTTGEMWRKAKNQTRRAFYEQLYFTIEECWTEFEFLNRTIEEKFDRNQAPAMTGLKKILEDIRPAVKRFLQEKREQEPDAVEEAQDGAARAEGGESGAAANGGGVAAATGAIRSRQDALKRLSDVAEFFRRTEPHSPVSYLAQRAVKWGNMPLDNWLQEVIKDEAVLGQLRETLGFGAYSGGDGAAADYSDSSDSSDSPESSESNSW